MILKNKRINFVTIFFILTTLLLAILLVTNQFTKDKERGYDSTTILNRVVPIQELALVKYNYSGVIGYKDFLKIMRINVPLTEKSFLLKYNGYIKAGVDFKDMKVEVTGKDVHISLPKPKILDTLIDEKSIRVYNESMNAFNPIKISDYNEAIMKEKDTMINDAITQGILRDATKQAEMVLTSIMKDMGFEKITITQEVSIPKPK
ncbi:MAG: DUF4230 domain-containing protein [Dysgonamonadaceae bacterium]|nr:DUF4230 domain-containing protein [Dysgonamonadaceae bacterium]MDD3356888.1 DUF4230 domain-containing protein [Dysgonamonadaceae bacterium]MDD3728301.1 DUF4230 domain-containing protein [Dysgonamonadaceae bacterium]MDD4606550.1 DUF4230 domain-containing protein [Dysgonamonadaceae bacterium]HUI32641.1 DUF4230 domain-containing protein [Dysgonamonadaceae bacterium]